MKSPQLPPEDEFLLQEYLATLTVDSHNTPRLFAIGFLGLSGSGKSTLANMLSERLHLPVNRNDQIRRFLNTKGFPGASPRQEIMAALAEACTKFFYRNHTSIIADANLSEHAAVSQASAKAHGASLLLIRLTCPDDVALARLRHRALQGDVNSSAATAVDYATMKAKAATFAPVKDVYFEIDSTANITNAQVQEIVDRLATDGYIA